MHEYGRRTSGVERSHDLHAYDGAFAYAGNYYTPPVVGHYRRDYLGETVVDKIGQTLHGPYLGGYDLTGESFYIFLIHTKNIFHKVKSF